MPRPLSALFDLGLRSLARFVELEGFDRAMALAGQGFAALLPLLIVIGSVTPTNGDDLADALSSRFNLDGSSTEALSDVVAQPPDPGIGALGAVLLVISALSFTRAMQRLYVRAWRLDSLGLRGNVWGLEWLGAFAIYWAVQPGILHLFDGLLAFVVSLALSTALWIATPWLLVARRIPWRRLLPQAVLTVIGLDALAIAGAIYLPRAFGSASQEFGVLGVAFTLLSLLFALSLVLVATAALGASIADPPAARTTVVPHGGVTRSG